MGESLGDSPQPCTGRAGLENVGQQRTWPSPPYAHTSPISTCTKPRARHKLRVLPASAQVAWRGAGLHTGWGAAKVGTAASLHSGLGTGTGSNHGVQSTHTGAVSRKHLYWFWREGERYIRQRMRRVSAAAGARGARGDAYLPALRAQSFTASSEAGRSEPAEATGRTGPRKWPWRRKPSEDCVPAS